MAEPDRKLRSPPDVRSPDPAERLPVVDERVYTADMLDTPEVHRQKTTALRAAAKAKRARDRAALEYAKLCSDAEDVGCSYQQIADALGVYKGAVHKLVRRYRAGVGVGARASFNGSAH